MEANNEGSKIAEPSAKDPKQSGKPGKKERLRKVDRKKKNKDDVEEEEKVVRICFKPLLSFRVLIQPLIFHLTNR